MNQFSLQSYISLDTLHRPREDYVTSFRKAPFSDTKLMLLLKSVEKCPQTVQSFICSLIIHLTPVGESVLT